MKRFLLAIGMVVLSLAVIPTHAANPGDTPRTRLVVLGVEHAAQLVSEADQPAMLAAFIERVAPAALCVERPPEQYARGDMYEFTYEIQDIVVPYARAGGIEICPFDWMPPYEDELLGFGFPVSQPPEVRPARGFQGFLTFTDPVALRRGLFEADDRAKLAEVDAWIRNWPKDPAHDLPRRLYLYRTFMQARRIQAAAKAYPGHTVLVIVGAFHKHDIEAILAADDSLYIVQPSSYGLPAPDAVARHTTRAQRVAIASFNLLGAQAATGNIDLDWMGRVLDALERERADPETDLLRTRFGLLSDRLKRDEAIERYRRIAGQEQARRLPIWNGVLDRSRVDSFFDPFGNLRIDQRARVELARELYARGDAAEADALLPSLKQELTSRKARQLEAYWRRDLVPPASG